MSRRLIYLNSSLLLLIILVFVFGDFFSPIDRTFYYWWFTKYLEWKILLSIVFGSAILSVLVGFIKIKKFSSTSRSLVTFLICNVLLLGFLIFKSLRLYFNTKIELENREAELMKEAKSDIAEDNVTYKFAGGIPLPTVSEKGQTKIDSIHALYGVKYINTGCVVFDIEVQAQEKYSEIVKPYLETRNGKNWEIKMKKQVEKVREDFPSFPGRSNPHSKS